MTNEGVHIVVRSDPTVIARVRDDAGIRDVTRGHLTGWSCSCGEDGPCCHVGRPAVNRDELMTQPQPERKHHHE